MGILIQVVLAMLLMTATVYVQKQVPVFTRGSTKIVIARLLLVVVGAAFGLTGASYVHGNLAQLLAFLIGFGMVHLPAAIILILKGKRGEGKS